MNRSLHTLTCALGLHLTLHDAQRHPRSTLRRTDLGYISPAVLDKLHGEWVADLGRQLPPEASPQAICKGVMSAEDFAIALVGHLDQVPPPRGSTPAVWLLRLATVTLAAATIALLVLAFVQASAGGYFRPLLGLALCAATATVSLAAATLALEDHLRRQRVARLSDAIRGELRQAIHHGFVRPVEKALRQGMPAD